MNWFTLASVKSSKIKFLMWMSKEDPSEEVLKTLCFCSSFFVSSKRDAWCVCGWVEIPLYHHKWIYGWLILAHTSSAVAALTFSFSCNNVLFFCNIYNQIKRSIQLQQWVNWLLRIKAIKEKVWAYYNLIQKLYNDASCIT